MLLTPNRLIAGLFLFLLAGAAFYATERVLFADASFILFRIINLGSLQIQEHRYGSFITQIVPWLASKLHLPLKTIAVLYSVSFNLFYLGTVLLLLYKFREYALAVLMSFYFLLFASETFFWMNNEVHQGIAWMFLFFGTTLYLGRKKSPWTTTLPLFLLLSFLALFTHPLVLLPMGFLWLFFVARTDWPYSRTTTLLLSVVLLALASVKLLLSTGAGSHYDAEKLQALLHLSRQHITGRFRTPLAKGLGWEIAWNYWLIPVLFVTGLLVAWREKARWPVVLTGGFTLVYFVALFFTFDDFLRFYTESELMPATIILTALFVYHALPKLKTETQAVLLAVIFLVRLAYIDNTSNQWIARKEWLHENLQAMRKQHITKALVPENTAKKDTVLLTWGTPVESMMASALSGDRPQLTFVVDRAENLPGRVPPDSRYMISSFEMLTNAALNQHYFYFDSTAVYRMLKPKEN